MKYAITDEAQHINDDKQQDQRSRSHNKYVLRSHENQGGPLSQLRTAKYMPSPMPETSRATGLYPQAFEFTLDHHHIQLTNDTASRHPPSSTSTASTTKADLTTRSPLRKFHQIRLQNNKSDRIKYQTNYKKTDIHSLHNNAPSQLSPSSKLHNREGMELHAGKGKQASTVPPFRKR